jgi:hypothetical protein
MLDARHAAGGGVIRLIIGVDWRVVTSRRIAVPSLARTA